MGSWEDFVCIIHYRLYYNTFTYYSMNYKLILKPKDISPFEIATVFFTYCMIVANTKVSMHMCTLTHFFLERKCLPSQLEKIKCDLIEVIILPKESVHFKLKEPSQQRKPSKIRIFLVNAGNIYSRTIQGRCPIYTTLPEGPGGSSVPFEEINLPIFHYLLPLDI